MKHFSFFGKRAVLRMNHVYLQVDQGAPHLQIEYHKAYFVARGFTQRHRKDSLRHLAQSYVTI